MDKRITTISNDAMEAMKLHGWKGNIRELRNTIERAVILSSGEEIELNDLPLEIQHTAPVSKHREFSAFELASAEKLHIQKVLNYTNGNKTKTAELLGIALTTLYRKLTEYSLG